MIALVAMAKKKIPHMKPQRMHMVRMWVTEGCNAFCHYCMNAKSRGSASMDLNHFTKLCEYFKYNNFDKIAIMGGEPTIIEDFSQFYKIAQQNFETVYLFTNALKEDKISLISPRSSDTIIYNFNFSKQFSDRIFLTDLPGDRVLDIVVDFDIDTQSVINEIVRICSISPKKIKVQLVLNNSSNIFKKKKRHY